MSGPRAAVASLACLALSGSAAAPPAAPPAWGARAALAGEGSSTEAWKESAAWAVANGGSAHAGLAGSATRHGGATVRGIVATEPLPNGTLLLEVPRRLWLTLENFPAFRDARLDGLDGCPTERERLMLQLSAVIATERRKGAASFYHVYLQKLPTLADFRAFHPRLAREQLLADFAALPLAEEMRAAQRKDEALKRCFAAWSRTPGSPVAGLTWEDMEQAVFLVRTRAYNTAGAWGRWEPSLIPASDLLNVHPSKVSARWVPSGSVEGPTTFKLFADSGPDRPEIAAGEELYEEYCGLCDNDRFMSIWGIYLEANRHRSKAAVDCGATAGSLESQARARKLRAAAEAALDVDGGAAALAAGWGAPRCKAATQADPDQGPLRCSLARLAWEHCAGAWGHLGWGLPAKAVRPAGAAQLSAADAVHLIDGSAIRAVHPALLSPRLRAKGSSGHAALGVPA